MTSLRTLFPGPPSTPLLKPCKDWLMRLLRQQQPHLQTLPGMQHKLTEPCRPLKPLDHRVKKRKRAEPIPRNAFPHVVEKVSNVALVSDPVCSCFLFRVWSPIRKLESSSTCRFTHSSSHHICSLVIVAFLQDAISLYRFSIRPMIPMKA